MKRPWVAVYTNDARHMAWVTRRTDGAGGSLLVGDQRIDVGVIDPDEANEMAEWLAEVLNKRHTMAELRKRAWPYIKPGGVVLCDYQTVGDLIALLREYDAALGLSAPEGRAEAASTTERNLTATTERNDAS